MPFSFKMGSLSKALRLDSDDKRKARLRYVEMPNEVAHNGHLRRELEAERKRTQRKVKDLTLRTNDDQYIRLRSQERRREEEDQKQRRQDNKTIESAIRLQKNREWRARREEEARNRHKQDDDDVKQPNQNH